MAKSALLVGIDHYRNFPSLTGCVADAVALGSLLERNEDGSPNYHCRLLTSAEGQPVTKQDLWDHLYTLFDQEDDILFHFSGHGAPTKLGGCLVTQDGTAADPGPSMDDLLLLANKSKAKTILLILDCCYAGKFGDPSLFQGGDDLQKAYIREGITILAAARSMERARETGGHGVFTQLALSALHGGAADVRGRVSAASIYAYVEQVLDSWEQRPMYKSYAQHLPPVRLCKPSVPDSLLRELPALFEKEDSLFRLAPSYEWTHPSAKPKHVKVFNKFKTLRNANLLTTQAGKDLYFIALESRWVKLTSLGRFYWMLAKKNQL